MGQTRFKEIGRALLRSRQIIFHPFRGFWEMKSQKQGNVKAAGILVLLLIAVLTLRRQWTGYPFNFYDPKDFSIIIQVAGVLLPFLLWCVSNWCITTLMDGEGSFKEIFVTSAYALVPMILLNIPMVILSVVLSGNEAMFYYLLDAVSILWTALLFLFGLMTIHQFSLAKTVATAAIALAGMVVIIFLSLLFVAQIQQMINFVRIFYKELALRYG